MRKDLDAVQDKSKSDIEAVRGELARLYSLIQWFIGLMFTIALGVFGLAIGNIVRGEKRSDGGGKDNNQSPARPEASAGPVGRDASAALPSDGRQPSTV